MQVQGTFMQAAQPLVSRASTAEWRIPYEPAGAVEYKSLEPETQIHYASTSACAASTEHQSMIYVMEPESKINDQRYREKDRCMLWRQLELDPAPIPESATELQALHLSHQNQNMPRIHKSQRGSSMG